VQICGDYGDYRSEELKRGGQNVSWRSAAAPGLVFDPQFRDWPPSGCWANGSELVGAIGVGGESKSVAPTSLARSSRPVQCLCWTSVPSCWIIRWGFRS